MSKEMPKQRMRFTDEELSIIKNTFAGNEDVLKVIRKVMLQLPLSAVDEAVVINTFKGKEALLKVIRKAFLPTLDGEAPIFQVVDLWATVELKEKTPTEAVLVLKSRKLLIDYVDQQLKKLGDLELKEVISFEEMIDFENKMPDSALSDIIARNTIINHTEQQLSQFEILAGQREESVEDTKKRLFKDSSK